MADISGYTAFVAGTEQDHSQEILAELMEAISRSFGGKLTVDQVEGDALCCTTDRTDVGVIDWLRETYRVFQRRLRDIRSATTCPCRACATVQDLGLKPRVFLAVRGRRPRAASRQRRQPRPPAPEEHRAGPRISPRDRICPRNVA